MVHNGIGSSSANWKSCRGNTSSFWQHWQLDIHELCLWWLVHREHYLWHCMLWDHLSSKRNTSSYECQRQSLCDLDAVVFSYLSQWIHSNFRNTSSKCDRFNAWVHSNGFRKYRKCLRFSIYLCGLVHGKHKCHCSMLRNYVSRWGSTPSNGRERGSLRHLGLYGYVRCKLSSINNRYWCSSSSTGCCRSFNSSRIS